ncbi:four-helix bundle copper-binding protein [Hyphomicrobium sp.]|uniref:four-helix bundle copper-binding protein n=1 Tax=Hyphomicrobium sp. TaxID=82 RepID=UPI002D792BC2|nr:four-helix bundle copper-binding protein [Hyphomicrobium sp.]HET6388552.1 four-helix bundle copper-binding protein [Hyphomicrobium sp.]
MRKLSAEMQECAERCQTCATTCFNMAMNHCLEAGGKHTEPDHFRLMMACAEICKASAAVLLTGIREHVYVCRACAEICRACATSCEKVGDMQECVDACRACAETCDKMSANLQKAA